MAFTNEDMERQKAHYHLLLMGELAMAVAASATGGSSEPEDAYKASDEGLSYRVDDEGTTYLRTTSN